MLVAATCVATAQTPIYQIKPEKVTVIEKDTALNTDTAIIQFTAIPSKVKSFQATVYKLGGTVSGKVYLQGTVDGNWLNIDSVTVTDIPITTKLFTVTSTIYYSYRAYYITTGTQLSRLNLSYLRRQDE
jgi:DNA gyrase/topoisomerase IV subunit B